MGKVNQFICLIFVIIFLFFSAGCEKDKEAAESQPAYSYVLNTNSKKIHKTSCGTGARIKASNRKEYRGNLSDLMNDGYTTCGNCFK